MPWKKILLIAALLLGVFIVVIFAILSTYDFNKLKPRIIQAVREVTGRELTLDGDLKVGLGLSAEISIENVSLQNAAWGSQAWMAGVKRLDAQVALLPLIRKRIEFERITLVEPDFLLEFSQSGQSNLDFGGTGEPGGTLPSLIFHQVEIEKGTFTYKDGESNKTHRLVLDRLSMGDRESNESNRLVFKGSFNGKPFEIGGFLDHLALSPETGEDMPVRLAAKFGQTEVTIEGGIEDLINGEGLVFNLVAQGKTIRDIGKLTGISAMPDLGPFKFTTTVGGSFSRLALNDIDVTVGSRELVAVNIKGKIEDLLTQQGIRLNFAAHGNDITGLEKLIGQPLPINGAFKISAKVHDAAPERYTLSEFKARLETNEIGGSIDIDLTAQRPKISLSLSSQNMNLRPILSAIDKKSRRAGKSFRDAKDRSENMPLSPRTHNLVTTADVDLRLHLNHILLPQVKIDELAVRVNLKDGHITVKAEGPSLPDMAELTGVKGVSDLGPFKLAFHLSDLPETLSVEGLVFGTGTPELAELTLTGSIQQPLSRRKILINFAARGQNAAHLNKFIGRPLPIKGAFSVSGQVVDTAIDRYQLKNLGIVLVENKIGGRVDLNLSGQRPRVSAMLSSQKLNLRPLKLSQFEKIAGLKNASDLGPVALQVEIDDPAGKLSIKKLDFQAGTPKLAQIKIDGFIKDLSAKQGINLKFAVSGEQAANLAKLVGHSIPVSGEFSVSGLVVDSAVKVYDLKDFRLLSADSDIRGQMTLNLTGQRPGFSARLASQNIDLRSFGSPRVQEGTAPVLPTASDTQKQAKENQASRVSEALKMADAEVKIEFKQILLKQLRIDDLTLALGLKDGHLQLTADSQSSPDMTQLTGVRDLPNIGPFRLHLRAVAYKDRLAVEGLNFNAAVEDFGEITLSGTAKDFLTRQGIALEFTLKGDDFSKLKKWTGRQLSSQKAFIITGRLADPASNIYRFSALKFFLGNSDLSGWLDLNLTGRRPKIRSELISQNLDLRWLYTAAHQNVQASEASASADKKQKKLFSNQSLPLDTLKIADLDVKIRAEKISFPRVVIRELIVDIMLADGHLTVKPLRFTAANGSLYGYLDARLTRQTAAITTDLIIDQIRLRPIPQDGEASRVLAGVFDGKIHVSSQGDSVAALMAALNGNITVVYQGGRIANRYLGILFGDLTTEMVKRINVFSRKQKYTDINCTIIHLDISDGRADNVFLIDTPQTKLIGAGKTDLKNETLDLGFKTSSKKGVKVPFLGRIGLSLGELTKPFKVGGTFANPTLVIDPSRTAITLGKLTAGLMLGPAGLAVVFADVSKKDADPCQEAINAIEKEDRDFMKLKSFEDKSTLKQTTDDFFEKTGDAVEDAGGTLKKYFSH